MVLRIVIALLISFSFPADAWAQGPKPVPLADYVSLCLGLWEGSPDVAAKASALDLQDMTGSAGGAALVVGKTTLRMLKSSQSHHMVGAMTTTFADGKDFSCDINLPMAVERGFIDFVRA